MKNKTIPAETVWEVAYTYIKTVVDTIRESFLILDSDLKVLSANKTFYATFKTSTNEVENKHVYELGNGQWNVPKLKVLLEDILPNNSFFTEFVVEHDFPKIGKKIMILNARRVYTPDEEDEIILLAIEDVTKQKLYGERQIKLTEELSAKTKELEARILELEEINKKMMEREKKMDELTEEIKKLKAKYE
jgi:nitrogen-specific signal transduction histidine kinase